MGVLNGGFFKHFPEVRLLHTTHLVPEAHVKVDTVVELVCLILFAAVACLVIWVLFRIDAAPEFPASQLQKAPRSGGEVVLYAGSWNPPHLGHFEMLRSMAARHTHIYACVGHNRSKTYAVSAERRGDLVRAAVDADPKLKGRVTVVVTSGYIWRVAYAHKCTVLFRGIRSWREDGPSEIWLHVLNLLGPIFLGPLKAPVETRYIRAEDTFARLSSTAVRKAVVDGKSLEDLVPAAIQTDVRSLYSPKVKGG